MTKVEKAQNKINKNFNYLTVVKHLNKDIYLFNDHKYGEFEGRLYDVLRRQKKHYKRQKSIKNLPLEEIKFRLNKKLPHLTLIKYNGFSNVAKFLDDKYGEFEAIFKIVYRKKRGHPERSKYNKAKHILSKEFKEKTKSTMIKKYGVENAMHNEEIKEKLKENNLKKYGVEYPQQNDEVKKKRNKLNKEKYGVASTLNLFEVQEKIKETNLEKYGAENPFQSDKIKDKIKQTNLKKYGVEHCQQNVDIQKKTQQTNIKLYGFKSPTQSKKIKEKIKQTNLKRYGVDNLFKDKNKIKQKMVEKYGVENPQQNKEIREKTKKTNLERYGMEYPVQNKEVKEKIKQTNIKAGKLNIIDGKTVKEFINDKNISITTANKIIRTAGINILKSYNKKYTIIEHIIQNTLDKNNIKYKNQKHFKYNDKNYFCDFFIKNKNLIIECDGLYWHSDAKQSDKNYHRNKQYVYKDLGYNSLFFREDEVLNKTTIVESIILAKLGLISNRVYARKCKIKEISSKEASKFFEENHLMGRGSGKCYALTYNDEIISAIRIIKKKNYIDISRFCNKLNTSVAGGLSKLIKHIIKKYDYNKIQSFVDMRYGDGQSLKMIGFIDKTNYISFKWTNFTQTFHRKNLWGCSGYKKGLYKIWDCGQKKFEFII